MITIDGSYGEGGGQILRYAASLAAAYGEKVKIINIRARRPNPGLRPQHLGGLKLLLKICGGEVIGLNIGSKEVILKYDKPKPGFYTYDIGTAGSISLILQTILPVLSVAKGTSKLVIRGGTDVKWSPTIDYFRYVFLYNLQLFGINTNLEVVKRGYYPKGGGEVKITVRGVGKELNKVHFKRERIVFTNIVSVCSNLPKHIAYRQINAFKHLIENLDVGKVNYFTELNGPEHAFGKGTSILIYSEMRNKIRSGGDCIGERGKPAESVGWDAYQKYLEWYNSGAALDRFMSDMVVPYMFLAGSGSFTSPKLTKHMESALYVSKLITNIPYEITTEDSIVKIHVG